MFNRRRPPGLSFKATAKVGLVRQLGQDHLQRHLAAQTRVLGQIDRAHAPTPDLFEDLEVTETFARLELVLTY